MRDVNRLPSDVIVPPGQMAVHVRTALRLLKEAEHSKSPAKLIDTLSAHAAKEAETYVNLPAILALALSCASTSGIPSAAILLADVAVLAGSVVISFTYTRTDGTGCEVKEITEVSLTDTTTGGGAQKMSAGALAKLEDQGIPATNPPEQRWTGKQTTVGASGGTISVGDVVTLEVTFRVNVTMYCHTCTPNPVKVSTNVTVK